MIFFKKYFVNSKEKLELLPITHDLRYAIRDANVQQALLTVQVSQLGTQLVRAQKSEAQTSLQTRQLSLIVEQGELQINKLEEIYLLELEEKPARREYLVQVLSAEEPKEKDKPKQAPARR